MLGKNSCLASEDDFLPEDAWRTVDLGQTVKTADNCKTTSGYDVIGLYNGVVALIS